ncbi:TolC family protein [Mycolicibacterium sp. XJ662]
MDPLDELYAARLEEFTALRTRLAAAAKKRGDPEQAKTISAARKPTTAAWVVNRLAHADDAVRQRLIDLGARLRQAHTEMDGDRIRELSAEQRRLVDDLTRAAFEEAELTNPSASLRDDVTATLQAAVADADVAARIGRLAKAEQWSGFGGFGDSTAVFKPTRSPKKVTAKKAEPAPDRDKVRAALKEAERAKAEADEALDELQADVATARLRHLDAQRRLEEAEAALAAAEDAFEKGKQASREAAMRLRRAKAR